MAEGGRLQLRSSKGTTVHKTVPSCRASRPPFGHKVKNHHGPCQCFPHRIPGGGLRVLARIHGEEVMDSSYCSYFHLPPPLADFWEGAFCFCSYSRNLSISSKTKVLSSDAISKNLIEAVRVSVPPLCNSTVFASPVCGGSSPFNCSISSSVSSRRR